MVYKKLAFVASHLILVSQKNSDQNAAVLIPLHPETASAWPGLCVELEKFCESMRLPFWEDREGDVYIKKSSPGKTILMPSFQQEYKNETHNLLLCFSILYANVPRS